MTMSMAATDTFREQPVRRDPDLLNEVRVLSSLVGELTMTLVVQGAYLSALKHRRARPIEFDVDEAISIVADSVPDSIADGLWSARDAVLARLNDEMSPA